MGRLIDADDFFERMKNDIDLCAEMEMCGEEALKKYLDLQPTAYDVDKVVEEIKTLKEEALGEYNMGEYNLDNNIGNSIAENYRKDMNEGRCFAYDDAIEIVEQGGVSDDVCEWILCDEEANVYDTSCRNPHILIEGTPKENNYEYCPYCEKKDKGGGMMDDFGSKLENDVLFTLDRIRSYERNKAIDDFVKEICKMIVQSENNGNYRFYAVEIKQSIADLAKQLKAGGK